MNRTYPLTFAHRRSTPGFTLVELMTAVAIAMILLLGVNAVFRMTGQTVKAGTAIAEIARGVRQAQSEMFRDMHYSLAQPPCFIVANHRQISPNIYLSPKALAAGQAQLASRLDRLSFFSSGDFYRRQTGDPGTYISPTSSGEAFITYGILQQINASNVLEYPGTGTAANTDSNIYSQNWILGRNALVLADARNINGGSIADKNYYPRYHSDGTLALAYGASPVLGNNDSDNTNGSALQSSRYDLAAVTIDQFRKDIFNAHVQAEDAAQNPLNPDRNPGWWMQMFWQNNGPALFYCKPTLAKAMTSRDVALTTPAFLNHVSSFVVEFAGDYLTQADDGTTTPGPDGKIDTIIDYADYPAKTRPVKRIRWYGARRNSRNPANYPADPGTALGQSPNDIFPLHELLLDNPNNPKLVNPPMNPADFVRLFPWDHPANGGDWRTPLVTNFTGDDYTCMWLNDAPAMVRVTFRIEDPTNALGDGRWYELILTR